MPHHVAKFLPCTRCRGVRLHAAVTRHQKTTGKLTRVWRCSACCRTKRIAFGEHPGLCCPKCGDCRLKVHYTTTHVRTLATLRVRRCRGCGHRVRTVERFEAVILDGPKAASLTP